jgi:hypothetical protein
VRWLADRDLAPWLHREVKGRARELHALGVVTAAERETLDALFTDLPVAIQRIPVAKEYLDDWADRLRAAGPLLDELRGRAEELLGGAEALERLRERLRTPPPAPPAPWADCEAEIVERLKARGWNKPAALVEFMIGRTSASSDDIAFHVHWNKGIHPGAIRKNVFKVNRYLEEIGSTIRYSARDLAVFKLVPPR